MKTITLATTPIQTVIQETIAVLQSGGLVLFPTETTYGAGVDATNQAAVDKLLAYKSRREGKPLSIMVTNQEMAEQYVIVNQQAALLYTQFLPGPVTVVSNTLKQPEHSKNRIAQGVASEFDTIGIRIPDYELMLKITQALGKPITATSANASGKKRPYSVADIFSGLSQKQKNLIDLVLDAGELPKNEPSTVIDTTLSTPVTLRSSNRKNHIQMSEKQSNNTTTTVITSNSQEETEKIAGRLLLKHWDRIRETGLVIALDGDLGVGKTVFAKGSAKFLKIEDLIKSPTYSYIEEYDFTRHQTSGRLYHLDMWKVASKELYQKLAVEQLLKPNTVVVIEWFSQIAEYIQEAIKQNNSALVQITLLQEGETRKLTIIESL